MALYISSLGSGRRCACDEAGRVVCSSGPEALFPDLRNPELEGSLLGLREDRGVCGGNS